MTTRITVSLPDVLVEKVKAAVARGDAESVSAYVADALWDRVGGLPLEELFAQWYAEDGPPSEEDHAWARAAFGLHDKA